MKVFLFGTDRHGVWKVLEHLLNENIEVSGCVFDEARPNHLSTMCEENGIPCYSTEQVYDVLNQNALPDFDLGISYLYHRLIREPLISYPSKGTINFHPAPTNVHKGVACCSYCLLKEFKEWAVTAHYVVPEIDEGDIIMERKFPMIDVPSGIDAERYIQSQSIELFKDVIKLFLNEKTIPTRKQNLEEGIYLSRNDLELIKAIDLSKDNDDLDLKIKALWFPPYHGAYVTINGKKYTLVNEELLENLASLYERQEDCE